MRKYIVIAYRSALHDYHRDYRGSHDSAHDVIAGLTAEQAVEQVATYLSHNDVNNHKTTTDGFGPYPYDGADWEIQVFEQHAGLEWSEEPSTDDNRDESFETVEARNQEIIAKATEKAKALTKGVIDQRLASFRKKEIERQERDANHERQLLAQLKAKYEAGEKP